MKASKLGFLLLGLFMLTSCGGATDTSSATSSEDSSSSGLAASSIGGALSGSQSSATTAQNSIWNMLIDTAYAATTCPSVLTTNGQGCSTNGSGTTTALLTLSNCSVGSSLATWSGTLEVSFTSGSVSCGAFPSVATKVMQRQFVSAASTPSTGSRTSARGTTVVVDHQTANLGNFDGVTISNTIGTGYGKKITFDNSGNRTQVNIAERLYVSGGFDHSVTGTINISESGGAKTASGSITVYHNKAKVIGTSTFSNVVYNNTRCVPVSGTITTAFTAGANVATTVLGSRMVGKSESITFNNDGTASYTDYSGSTSTVALKHCF